MGLEGTPEVVAGSTYIRGVTGGSCESALERVRWGTHVRLVVGKKTSSVGSVLFSERWKIDEKMSGLHHAQLFLEN